MAHPALLRALLLTSTACASVVIALLAAQGCGLDLVGGAEEAEAGGTADGAPLAPCAAPAGWERVLVRPAEGGAGSADAGNDGGADADGAPTPEGSRAACPDGWFDARRFIVGIRSAAATCTCSCGAPLLNPCLQGATTAAFRTGNSNCNDGDRIMEARDGGCFATGFSWTGFNTSDGSTTANGLSAPPPTPAAVACGATATLPAVIDDGTVDVCGRNPDCAASAPAGATICILAKGRTPCPPGYSKTRELSTRDTIKDGRTCAECSCHSAATSCVEAMLTFYSDDSCSIGARSVTLDGKCNAISGTVSPTRYRFSARPDSVACNADSGSVAIEGNLESDPLTLCCPE